MAEFHLPARSVCEPGDMCQLFRKSYGVVSLTGRAGVTGAAPRRARLRPFGLDPAAIRQAAIASLRTPARSGARALRHRNKLHYVRDVSLGEN
jgi:hypothetical protein